MLRRTASVRRNGVWSVLVVLAWLLTAGLAPGVAATGASTAVEAPILKGVVVDTGGRGIEGASVYVELDPARPRDAVSATTDAAGAFELRHLDAPRVLLRVEHPAFAPAVVEDVAVRTGHAPGAVRITLLSGARIEGVVRHRDGRPFTGGRVVVQGSSAAEAYAPPLPIAPDENGGFAADHVSPGTAHVYVLAFTPGRGPRRAADVPTLSPIGTATATLHDGETTTVDVALRDVVVSGRVTRGGRGVGGIRLALSGPVRSISFPGMPADPTPVDPPMLSATTREDGTYDVVAFEPGPARVRLSDASSGEGLAVRPVVVADADRFALDVEITEATVAGVVVRSEDGAPLEDVLLTLAPAAPGAGSAARGRSAADGRFAIGAEPGEYRLRAEVLGRVPVVRPLSLSLDGLADLRLEMGRGRAIVGRLLDEGGRPVSSREVFAFGADGFERTVTRGDGGFRLEGLGDGPYALSSGAPLSGFAIRPGVRPGPEPVTLALRAGGRIELRVLSPEGRPVPEAFASVVAVDGGRVDPGLAASPPTDDDGRTALRAPVGEVAIVVRNEVGAAFRTVALRADETAIVEVRLESPGP